jgi:hypothetical protein
MEFFDPNRIFAQREKYYRELKRQEEHNAYMDRVTRDYRAVWGNDLFGQ